MIAFTMAVFTAGWVAFYQNTGNEGLPLLWQKFRKNRQKK
jgi:hypothetical protein